jgi:GPH family glycoside/pentoside/hexuronide:cation symporter/probable glucitol transport protein GutA
MDNNNTPKKATTLAVICYGLGDLASQFIWTFVGSYLTIFYTDIVGFTPVVVSGIMLVARVWDAVNDPMMGSIAENTRSKFGRFRPYIAFGSPFLAVFSIMTFINMGNGTGGVILSAVIYIIAGMLYTLVNIPYSSLAAVMTEDPNQRALIGTSRSVGMNIGMIIVNSCSAGLALHFSGSGAEVATGHGYMMTAVVYSLVAVPLFLIVFFTSKEVIMPENESRKLNPAETLGGMVKNKYLMTLFIVSTVQMIAFMGRISVTAFYVIYCLGAFTLIALIMTIPSIGGVIGSLAVAPLAKRIGKKRILAFTLMGQAAGLLIVFFAPFDNMRQILIGHWIYGIFNCGFPLCLAMVADCVDFWEEKTGIRQDGSYYATYGLSTKLGNAIGSAVSVLIMGGFGYVAGSRQQSAEALRGINITVNLIPAILLVCASILLLVLWDKSDRDFDEIRERVRHGGSGAFGDANVLL